MTFRHYVLSAAAVFLALAVGVVLGARILSDPMVVGLRGDKGDLQQQIGSLRADNGALDRRLLAADDFDSRMSGRIVRDALAATSVLLVRTPDASDDDVAALSDLIARAGGSVSGTLDLTPEFVGANSAEKLRSVVNSPIVPPGAALNVSLTDPAAQAGDLLGVALQVRPDSGNPGPANPDPDNPDPDNPGPGNPGPKNPPVDDAARQTVLATLRDTGFVTYSDGLGPADCAVVLTGGALGSDAGNQGTAVARFAAGLAPHGSATVLAGRQGSAEAVAAVGVVRADTGLSGAVSTVDDVGTAAGRITTVLALQARKGGAPTGQYGVGPGAAAVTVGP